jgi:hypothetical protein
LAPDLTTSLSTAATTVGGGDQVVYTLGVYNVGQVAFVDRFTGSPVYFNAPASGISALFTLPGAATFQSVSVSAGFNCVYVAPVVTCSGGSLASGASATITVTVLAPRGAGSYGSTFTVDPTNAIAERNEGNNSSSLTLVVPAPDLSLSVVASDSTVDDGSLVTYYVRVDNAASSAEASAVTVRYTLPAGATLWSAGDGEPGFWSGTRVNQAGFTCSTSGGVVTCSGGTLGAGRRGSITLTLIAPRMNGVMSSTFVVDPQNTVAEQNEGNNSASVSTTVHGRPDLAVEVSHAFLPLFQRVVTVRNLGAGPATDVRVVIEATKWEYYDDGGPDVLAGVFPDSGFSCSIAPYYAYSYINYNSGKVLTCTGGTIPAGGVATLRSFWLLTTTDDSRNTDVVADPQNTVREVREDNNHATATTRI